MMPSYAWLLVILVLQTLVTLTMAGTGVFVGLRILSYLNREAGNVLVYDEIPLTGVTTQTELTRMLKYLRRLEAAVKAQCRPAAFLSIDVEKSTLMKRGEDDIDTLLSFDGYDSLVKRCLQEGEVWKFTQTPDGIMAAFKNSDLAFHAAKQLLARLRGFNATENKLKMPFRVRCGIAWSAKVAMFEDSELERVVDSSIDFAGHLQKAAPAGSVLVGSIAQVGMEEKNKLAKWDERVDGAEVYIYRNGVN